MTPDEQREIADLKAAAVAYLRATIAGDIQATEVIAASVPPAQLVPLIASLAVTLGRLAYGDAADLDEALQKMQERHRAELFGGG